MDQAIETKIYQRHIGQKPFADLRHMVVMVQTSLTTPAVAQVVCCRRDLALSAAPLMDYDRWRCQRECTVREAKP
jgi:hypothetical protein